MSNVLLRIDELKRHRFNVVTEVTKLLDVDAQLHQK